MYSLYQQTIATNLFLLFELQRPVIYDLQSERLTPCLAKGQ